MTGSDVVDYYKNRVSQSGETDFLWQVGKTVEGQPISEAQFTLLLQRIIRMLDINQSDTVLDIGSANGFITRQIAGLAKAVVGVDVSEDLHRISEKYNAADNINYFCADIVEDNCDAMLALCNKGYMYEVIQHIEFRYLDRIFSHIKQLLKSSDDAFFIGGVLDAERKWNFFNSYQRREFYFNALEKDDHSIGRWHHKDFFEVVARRYGLKVDILDQEEEFYTSHYRFDCLVKIK